MYEQFATALVTAIYVYMVIGAVVALVVVSFGLTRVDSEARGAGLGFRLIIFPGAVALWPLLLKRYIRGRGEPPAQKDPHR
jgi:hypothetical protein